MKCPRCKKRDLVKAFTMDGDIGFCMGCQYKYIPKRFDPIMGEDFN